jgi:uncharacterized membrane protein
MWARTVECLLGVWLAISWIIFDYKENEALIWHDHICLIFIGSFSLLSFWTRLRHLHLMNFIIVLWLGAFSYFLQHLGLKINAQNYMTLAWLLFFFSIVPSHANRPSYQWIKYTHEGKSKDY